MKFRGWDKNSNVFNNHPFLHIGSEYKLSFYPCVRGSSEGLEQVCRVPEPQVGLMISQGVGLMHHQE